MSEKNKTIIISTCLVATTLFMGVAFCVCTVVPYMQMSRYFAAAKSISRQQDTKSVLSVFDTQSFIFKPETYVQGYMRKAFLDDVFNQYGQQEFRDMGLGPLLDTALDVTIEYSHQHPYFYEYYFAIAKAYDAKFSVESDPAYLKEAEVYYRKALEVVPERQEVIYAYSINLLNQNRGAEAVAMLESALRSNPEIPQTQYELAQAYSIAGEVRYADALGHFEVALDRNVNIAPSLTKQVYLKFFAYFYKKQDFARFQTTVQRLVLIDSAQKGTYETILEYIKKEHRIPLIHIKN